MKTTVSLQDLIGAKLVGAGQYLTFESNGKTFGLIPIVNHEGDVESWDVFEDVSPDERKKLDELFGSQEKPPYPPEAHYSFDLDELLERGWEAEEIEVDSERIYGYDLEQDGWYEECGTGDNWPAEDWDRD